jgi:hypothetical protein
MRVHLSERNVGPALRSFSEADADMIRYFHGNAEVAGHDGDDVGYQLAKIAQVKTVT